MRIARSRNKQGVTQIRKVVKGDAESMGQRAYRDVKMAAREGVQMECP